VQRVRGSAEGVTDATCRVGARGRPPEAAAQGHDRGVHLRAGLKGVGGRRHRGTVPDAHDHAVPDELAEDLPGKLADSATRHRGGTFGRRGEVDGPEAERGAELLARRRRCLRPIDDADLDDALLPRLLEQTRDLRPSHADDPGDLLLGLTQLVVQAADANERGQAAQRRGSHVCPEQMCTARMIAPKRRNVNDRA
jgi:hypothetical protein